MSTSVTLNGTSYPIPTKGDVDWSSLTKWVIAANNAIGQSASGSVTPVYNVKNYGALGDGSTDDTNAIKAAMAVLALRGLSGGSLYFPGGTYKFTSKLQFGVAVAQRNVIITGDGVSSILKPTGAFSIDPAIEFRDCDYWHVDSVKIDSSARTGTGPSVLIDGCAYGSLTASTVSGSPAYGISVTQVHGAVPPAYNSVTGNVYASNVSGNVLVKEGTTGNIVNQANGVQPGSPTVNVKDYGAVGDGAADDTNAVKAAIAALWHGSGNLQGGTLFFPRGDYKITDTLDFSGHWGFKIKGEGGPGTRLKCSGMVGKDLIYVLGSQLWGVEDIALWGDATSRPSAMVHSRMESAHVFATYAVNFTNVLIYADANDAFDYGIRVSTDGSGNNSEFTYTNVTINYAKEACVKKAGPQAKDHNFYNCNFGVSKYGIDNSGQAAGIGWYGGSAAILTTAVISGGSSGDPYTIEGLRVESVERFLDMGTTQSNLQNPVSIRGCSAGLTPGSSSSLSSWIQYSGVGPLTIEDNLFFADDGPIQIKVSSDTPCKGSIKKNAFQSLNSINTSPVVNNSVFALGLEIDSNNYVGAASDIIRYRPEPLGSSPTANAKVLGTSGPQGKGAYIVQVDLNQYKAAALTQSLAVLTFPKGGKIRAIYLYWNDRVVLPTTPTINAKLGSSSGGNEYVVNTDVSAADAQFVGGASASLGASLTTDYVQGGFVPDFFNDTSIYLSLTSSSGNVGTGSVTRITGGNLFVIAEIDVLPRWIT